MVLSFLLEVDLQSTILLLQQPVKVDNTSVIMTELFQLLRKIFFFA